MRTRIRRHSSQRTTLSSAVARIRLTLVVFELEAAALAAALVRRGGAYSPVAAARSFSYSASTGRGSGTRPLRSPDTQPPPVDLAPPRIASSARGNKLSFHLALLLAKRDELGSVRPESLEHSSSTLLEVGLTLVQRGAHRAGGSRAPAVKTPAGVRPLLVPLGASNVPVQRQPHLVTSREMSLSCVCPTRPDPAARLVPRSVLRSQRSRAAWPSVRELVEPRVQLLDVEQVQLGGGIGVQVELPSASTAGVGSQGGHPGLHASGRTECFDQEFGRLLEPRVLAGPVPDVEQRGAVGGRGVECRVVAQVCRDIGVHAQRPQ